MDWREIVLYQGKITFSDVNNVLRHAGAKVEGESDNASCWVSLFDQSFCLWMIVQVLDEWDRVLWCAISIIDRVYSFVWERGL